MTIEPVIHAADLFIPRKDTLKAHPDYKTDMRRIEVWARTLEYTKGGGTGTHYASLTGVGETTTPGALTQLGTFTIQTGHLFHATMSGSQSSVTLSAHATVTTAHAKLTATGHTTATLHLSASSTTKTAFVGISAKSTEVGPTHALVSIFSGWAVTINASHNTTIRGVTAVTVTSSTGKVTIYGRRVQMHAYGTGTYPVTITGRQIRITAFTHTMTIHAHGNLEITGGLIALIKSPNFVRLSAPAITLSNLTAGVTTIKIGTHLDKLGFFNNNSHTRITVTGSRGGNAALASLLTALGTGTNGYGLINNTTTP